MNNPNYCYYRFENCRNSTLEFRHALEHEFPNYFAEDIKNAVEEYVLMGTHDEDELSILYSLLANIQYGGLKLKDALPKMNGAIWTQLDLDSFISLIKYAEAYKAQNTPESQDFLTSLFDGDGYVMRKLVEKELERGTITKGQDANMNGQNEDSDFQLADVFATILPDIYYKLNNMTWPQVLHKFNRQFGCQITLSQLKAGVQPLITRKIEENSRLYGTTTLSGNLLTATVGF